MRARENELLLPRLPDADGPMQFTFDDRPIDVLAKCSCAGRCREQLNERNYGGWTRKRSWR